MIYGCRRFIWAGTEARRETVQRGDTQRRDCWSRHPVGDSRCRRCPGEAMHEHMIWLILMGCVPTWLCSSRSPGIGHFSCSPASELSLVFPTDNWCGAVLLRHCRCGGAAGLHWVQVWLQRLFGATIVSTDLIWCQLRPALHIAVGLDNGPACDAVMIANRLLDRNTRVTY